MTDLHTPAELDELERCLSFRPASDADLLKLIAAARLLDRVTRAAAYLETLGGVLRVHDITYDLDPESVIEAATENGWEP